MTIYGFVAIAPSVNISKICLVDFDVCHIVFVYFFKLLSRFILFAQFLDIFSIYFLRASGDLLYF